jgi:hypothetical protein
MKPGLGFSTFSSDWRHQNSNTQSVYIHIYILDRRS